VALLWCIALDACDNLALLSSRFVQVWKRSEKLSACPGFHSVHSVLSGMEDHVSESLHPGAPHDLPGFITITAPGNTDILMVVVGIVLIGAVLAVGNLYLHLHTFRSEWRTSRESCNSRSWPCCACWRSSPTSTRFGWWGCCPSGVERTLSAVLRAAPIPLLPKLHR
jgi:hypothetical protein